ncbi:MAG TPA: hypothetical protein VNH83_08690 [Bryobacteraceae bacterium]|nr:hypothetical protein [Bryobacteraceae bacterium]
MVKRYWHAKTSTLPPGWNEYVDAPSYDALAAELAAQIEDCTVNYNQRVILTNRVGALEQALTEIRNMDWSNKAAPTLVGMIAMNALGEKWYHGSESETKGGEGGSANES